MVCRAIMKVSAKEHLRLCCTRPSLAEVSRSWSTSLKRPEGRTVALHPAAVTAELFPREVQHKGENDSPSFSLVLRWDPLIFLGHSSTSFRFVKRLTLLMALSSHKCQLFWSLSRGKYFDSHSVHYSSERGSTHIVICRNTVSPPCSCLTGLFILINAG